MVPQKDVASWGHSVGELAMNHRPLVSWVENMAMAGDERGYWPHYVGELWDAAPKGSSESVFAIGHGVWVPRAEDWVMAEDGPLTPMNSGFP